MDVGDTQDATNATFPLDEKMGFYQRVAIIAINLLLSLIGTFGNFLIIIAVLKTPQLRQKPSNNLLLSLAVADMIVTMVAQPLFATFISIITIHESCSISVNVAYLTATSFSGCCSTLHLAAISVDRAISTVKPHQHRDILRKWSKVILGVCWGSGITYGSLFVKFPEVKIVSQVSLISGFAIMICSYGMIMFKIKAPNFVTTEIVNVRERALEKRVSGTIAIVILLYAVCWFPIVVYNLYGHNYSMICSFDVKLSWIRSLLLANSSMNFIVYSLRIRHFRAAYVRLIGKRLGGLMQATRLCLQAKNEQHRIVVTSIASSSVDPT